ncbi:MAG: hypothetical protein ABSG53_08000 [Thermoguttaceae bacterium]|jgi:hypothetical protein
MSHDSFIWRQFRAAGLGAVAEKVAVGRDLELDDALALSHASLPLLGRIVQLRPAASNICDTAVAGPSVQRVASLPGSPRHIGQPLADWETFCRTLIATRGEVSLNGASIFWYPAVGRPLDRDSGCDGDYTGVDILRAIGLARLILPTGVEVQAPLATLGPKLALVALDFGASHLGYAAPDGQTPSDPLVADPSVLEELMECCLLTALKDEWTVAL